jgi:glycosyltransferase involved in cell wall biosynthesis
VTSMQVIPYRIMQAVLRRSRATVVVVCHNVLPHERRYIDLRLVPSLLGAADRVIVHSDAEAKLAGSLSTVPVAVAHLPPFMPSPSAAAKDVTTAPYRRLLFFGMVRPYKGLDVALRALQIGPPDVKMRVAGEFWGGADETRRLCADLGITERVEIQEEFVPADELTDLFSDVDALVLPYRSATGTVNVWLGFEFGVPVIATRVGTMGSDVRDGVDGLLAEPDDVESLAAAYETFYKPDTPAQLRSAVRRVDQGKYWRDYVELITQGVGRDPSP